jgi:hypothetical protein
VQPAVADGFGGRLGPVPVALHDGLAAQDELAHLAGRDVGPVGGDDAGLGVGYGVAAAGVRPGQDVLGATVIGSL